jgi:hypothetical protein
MKKFNTVGRPKKRLSEIKPYRANVKMSTETFFTLKAKAKESGVTISEFIRLAVTNSVIKQRLSPVTLDLIRKLCGMANNLNQLARSANTFGYNDDNIKFMFLADEIDNLLNMIRL